MNSHKDFNILISPPSFSVWFCLVTITHLLLLLWCTDHLRMIIIIYIVKVSNVCWMFWKCMVQTNFKNSPKIVREKIWLGRIKWKEIAICSTELMNFYSFPSFILYPYFKYSDISFWNNHDSSFISFSLSTCPF